jgi:hypothetical protein
MGSKSIFGLLKKRLPTDWILKRIKKALSGFFYVLELGFEII